MIPEEIIREVLDLDIVSVFEDEGIHLKRQGASRMCCCPFHGEKTPSLSVSSARNLWHCFGCGKGGTAITFIEELKGMTFPEAVKYLASRNGIQYEERELTPEEREEMFKREQLMAVNKEAMSFFCECLKTSPGASEYCKKRGWSQQTLEDYCIGYAPAGGALLKHLEGKGWKRKVILEAGLAKENPETGNVYDTFRERVIFPLHDKSGHVCGFSGRDISLKDGMAKYLNTSDTPIFKKGRQLFGLYQAYRQISTTETVYLVEGNPDAIRLHQIGIDNVVAPLGTALTGEQCDLIRTKARTVVIIGDTDSAGIKAVENEGRLLIEKGLNVRVMSLPEGKDADEYFLIREHEFQETYAANTEDYLPWLTARKMEGKKSQSEILSVITEIAEIMAYCQNSVTVEMYLSEFTKKYKYGTVWKAELIKARNAKTRKDAKVSGFDDLLGQYGFYIKNSCYYSAGDKRWSNFILKPILHIRDEKNARRIFQIVNEAGQECVVKLAQSELVSFTDFKTRTESAGNYVWEAGQPELTSLKKYLYNGTPSADEIRQLGWQKTHGFYAFGNGGLQNGTFEKVDKFGIVTISGKKYYLPGAALDTKDNIQGYQMMRKFVYAESNNISLRDFATKLIDVFGNNGKVGLCFLLATLFRDIVVGVNTSFPILNLFGPKGTGKSELGHSLMAFFAPGAQAPNISNTTKAGLAEAVAEVSNAIVHLDEYKNDIDLEKREFLKGIWDGTGRSKINIDNDKRRETTAVDCGVVISGQEMPTADIALFNRLVFLTFSQTQFSDTEKRRFEDLQLVEKRGLTHLTAEILNHRSHFQGNYRLAFDEAMADINNLVRNDSVEDRTLRNWTVILSAFKCLRTRLDLPMTYEEMLKICADGCRFQNRQTVQSNELSGFWGIVEALVSSFKIWNEADYKIKMGAGQEMKITKGRPIVLQTGKRYLFLKYNRVASLYLQAAKAAGGHCIPKDSLRFYLEMTPEFRGTTPNFRFRMIENQQGYMSSNSSKTTPTSAMVFDYDTIVNKYGINIDIDEGPESEQEDSDGPVAPLNPQSSAVPPIPDLDDIPEGL